MSERGHVTIAMLAILPLLFTVFAFLAGALMLFKGDGAVRHVCRSALLASQEKIARDLRSLVALNPRAAILRAKRQAAESAVAASSAYPVAAAAARARLAAVISQQMAFASKQRNLIFRSRIASAKSPAEALARVKLALYRSVGTGNPKLITSTDGDSAAASFELVANPPSSLTPDYQPSPAFEKKQEMRVSWSISLNQFLPQWLSDWIPAGGLRSGGKCSVTIEKEAREWVPKITWDKR